MLIKEEKMSPKISVLVSKVLQCAEQRYPEIEKLAFALVTTAKKLQPYFLSYPIINRTNTHSGKCRES